MKLGVFGSRTISDNRVKMEIAEYLQENSQYDTIVTTQEPKGVCQLAQIFAKENSMILELHFLNIKKYAKGAFEHRSDNVIKSADYLLFIHDGESKGTQNEIERAEKFKKPYKYVKLDKTTQLQNSETADILSKDKKDKKKDTTIYIDQDIMGLDDNTDISDYFGSGGLDNELLKME